jgi:hypothetical protein
MTSEVSSIARTRVPQSRISGANASFPTPPRTEPLAATIPVYRMDLDDGPRDRSERSLVPARRSSSCVGMHADRSSGTRPGNAVTRRRSASSGSLPVDRAAAEVPGVDAQARCREDDLRLLRGALPDSVPFLPPRRGSGHDEDQACKELLVFRHHPHCAVQAGFLPPRPQVEFLPLRSQAEILPLAPAMS